MTKKNWKKVTAALCQLPLGKEVNTDVLLAKLEISLPNIREVLALLTRGEYVKKEGDSYRLLRHPVRVEADKCLPFNERNKQLNIKEDVQKRKEDKSKKSR